MKTFVHSGNLGDVVFSIPTIQYLSVNEGAVVYVKAANYVFGNQYDAIKDLLLQQDGIKEVHPFYPSDGNWNYFNWPGLKYDYDLDRARLQAMRGRIHIVKRYFDAFGIDEDHRKPFLKIDEDYKRDEKFALIHLTDRWNGLQYDWKKIYNEAKQRHEKIYFIGFVGEHMEFTIRYGEIEHIITENLLEMARLVRDCEAIYCNQGVALTLAQGLGKEYYLVMNGMKTNCHLGTENEHLLGTEYLIPNHTLIIGARPDSHLNHIFK
jgi:hypothetical protein